MAHFLCHLGAHILEPFCSISILPKTRQVTRLQQKFAHTYQINVCENKDRIIRIPHGDQSCGIFKSWKGVAFRDTLLTLRTIIWKQIRKIYRVNRRKSELSGIQDSFYRSRLTGYLWRDAGVSWNTTPRHYCNVFLPGGSYHPFPRSSFSTVRLQSSFALCKTGSLPWLAAPLQH